MIIKEKPAELFRLIRQKSFAVCCGLAPVALLIVVLFTFKFGCNVIVDGKIIGTAKSRDYVYNLIDSINEDFAPYFDGENTITVKPVTTPKLVYKGKFTPKNELCEALKSTCPYLKKAYSIKSDSQTIVAFYTKSERKKAYNDFLSQYADTDIKDSYKILNKVEFVYELVPYGMIKNSKKAVNFLSKTNKVEKTVKIEKNTKLYDILTKYCMSEADFALFNPDYKEGNAGKVKISSEIPVIKVLSVENFCSKQALRYNTKTIYDNTMYKGQSAVKESGKDGLKSENKQIYRLNGKTIIEEINNENTIDACDEIILVGTKRYSTGKFSRPYGGTLSSRFGERDGRKHDGIDICGNVGDNIYASDGGEVIFAGLEDGYGNVIKIDHKNGYITYYAHCSELYATVGQIVGKGDVIAALGNTGRSTGPHVHFEVRDSRTGTPLDPLLFIN